MNGRAPTPAALPFLVSSIVELARLKRHRVAMAALLVSAVVTIQFQAGAQGAAARIDSVTPESGRPGDLVTITGKGFGALNVKIAVGGVAADVLSATGNKATFRVPSGAPFGATTVRATNPGGHSGEIGFTVDFDLDALQVVSNPDSARAATKTIGRLGGTVETDGADGTHYELFVPAGAMHADT